EDKAQVEKDIEAVKEALKGDDTDRIKSATDALMQSFQRVGQAVYQQAQAQDQAAPAGGGGGEATPGGDDVVEGEVVDEGGGS
ncbi:MAG TPA: molecular chaperone DnaK, partial [Actinomycetota bacterium]|nr:molecular chaperone DnaK [Actinomycetota bacterium]